MNCEDCYRNGICFFCVEYFGCHKLKKTDKCFKCDKQNCRNEKEE